MNKKLIIILVIIIAIVAGVVGYFWYNSQFDENLQKASGYQKLSLKIFNNDYLPGYDKINYAYMNIELLKTEIPKLQKYLDEAKDLTDNIQRYLLHAKNFAKNDAEKDYINLLLEKNENNKKLDNYNQEILNAFKDYLNGKITVNEGYQLTSNITKKYDLERLTDNGDRINNDINKLLAENPDFKRHLIDLDIDKTYLGESPSK